MASNFNSGIYSLNEFKEKGVLKLAPDAFVSFNNSYGHKIVSATTNGPLDYKAGSRTRSLDYRGGISSISTSTSVAPGQGTCSLTVVCPQYEGLHENYYVEQDDGTKVPYFLPLMEVKVFAKGRFLPGLGIDSDSDLHAENSPRYYPIFWGYTSSISESYSGGITTFNLSCRDMLSWWEFQNVNIVAGTLNQKMGGAPLSPTGTVFRYMSPWEIILNLFNEVGYDTFTYPSNLKGNTQLPNSLPGYYEGESGAFAQMKNHTMAYWDERFPFKRVVSNSYKKEKAESTLEMFGLSAVIDLQNEVFFQNPDDVQAIKTTEVKDQKAKIPVEDSNNPSSGKVDQSNGVIRLRANNLQDAKVGVDFGMLDKVMPYGNFAETGVSGDPEPTTESKLAIAAKVTSDIGFEFFLDPNGNFVFKPPFFNMDVSRTTSFCVSPADIISFNDNFDVTQVVNAVDVTGPMVQNVTTVHVSASHWDFQSIAKFGLRYKSVQLSFGSNAEQLQALAVSEMARACGLATTASMEIPLRPELRLGYPIYITHMDCFYYVKGLSHSINFGSAATTSITLDSKRSKVRDSEGKIMRAYTYRTMESLTKPGQVNEKALSGSQQESLQNHIKDRYAPAVSGSGTAAPVTGTSEVFEQPANNPVGLRDQLNAQSGFFSGLSNGLYMPIPSEAYYGAQGVTSGGVGDSTTQSDRSLTELVYFTKDSVPYTDVNGYNHIGAFPFGANLLLNNDFTLRDKVMLGSDQNVVTGLTSDVLAIGATKQDLTPAPASDKVAPDMVHAGDKKPARKDTNAVTDKTQDKPVGAYIYSPEKGKMQDVTKIVTGGAVYQSPSDMPRIQPRLVGDKSKMSTKAVPGYIAPMPRKAK